MNVSVDFGKFAAGRMKVKSGRQREEEGYLQMAEGRIL